MKNEYSGFRRLSLWIWVFSALCLPFSARSQPDPCSLAWTLVTATNPPGKLSGQSSAYDSRRHVAVFFGGARDNNLLNSSRSTWEWNGVNWEEKKPSIHPPSRLDGAMTFDDTRGVCVLFGGNSFDLLNGTIIEFNDTWEWDGSTWTLNQESDLSATNRPPYLQSPVMAYDSARKRTVLIGYPGGTWEWDGTNWSEHAAPPLRVEAAMAYDSVRRVTVLFGGTLGGNLLNDTWTWDGTNWTLVATGQPPGRRQHAMTFDSGRQVMVMFGGNADNRLLAPQFNDTWEWNGQSWSLAAYADRFGLSSRTGHQIWYDTGGRKMLLFGGLHAELNADGSYGDVEAHADLWEARSPGYWVDFNAPGLPSFPETGYINQPFNTLAEAVSSATAGCTLNLKVGSRAEVLTISKPLTLEAYYGPATIGRQ
jgi:hypothetical protein